ncbi:MAG TPA: HlyD family secretion protein [Abditibacteriaceae bacterium]|jgi:biotin carboxyl carrier protein
MSLISSSAPASAAAPPVRRGLSFSPLLGGVPAALLLALAATARLEPYDVSSPATSVIQPASETVPAEEVPLVERPGNDLATMLARGEWPRSQTFVAMPLSQNAVWTGRLQAMSPVRGRAPMAGQVARVSVRVGQTVGVNDTVLELSSVSGRPSARANSRAERRQTAAERAQVEAANQQAQLQQKMKAAQTQLVAAQKRVAAAQERVDEARDVVRKLQRGETVAAPKPRRAAARVQSSQNRKSRAALAAAESAQAEARAARSKAAAAEREANAAEAKVAAAEAAIATARTAGNAAQKRFDGGEIKASELDVARAAVEDAEARSKTLAATAKTARKNANALLAAADDAARAAKSAQSGATRSLREMTVFGGESSGGSASESATTGNNGGISVTDAARLARSALNESAVAVAEARRIKNRVDDYARQVSSTRSQIDSSTRQLASAQDAILDQTIQSNLSVVRAPASGVVESVAPAAASVGEGETVVTIGRSNRLRVVWTTTGDAWRALRADQVVTVEVVAPNGTTRSVSARISEITPAAGGKSATVEAMVDNPRVGGSRALQGGWQVRLAAPAVSGTGALANVPVRMPQEAIVGGPVTVGTLARVAVLTPVAGESEAVRLVWRQIRVKSRAVGPNTAGEWAVAGVRAGETVALRPEILTAALADAASGVAQLRLTG